MITKYYSVADTAVEAVFPDTNIGGQTRMDASGLTSYSLVKFALPPYISAYDISYAKLYFYILDTANAARLNFHRISSDWKEGTGTNWYVDATDGSVTWNTKPSFEADYRQIYISSASYQWFNIDLTSGAFYDSVYGFLIKQHHSDDFTSIGTREAGVTRCPYLEISYKLKQPVLSVACSYIGNGFKLTWNKQAINYYQPSSYRVFKYNPVVNEYVFVTTLDSNTFEYIDYELFDYDYEYKYCIDARYNDEGTWKYTNPVFVVGGTLYKSDVPQVELAAVGGQSAMRHLINTTHSEFFDELNNIEISTWKKSLDATSVSRDVDLRLTGDGNTLAKNILPIDDSNLGDVDNRWLEIHSEELKTDTSKTAKLRLWNGR